MLFLFLYYVIYLFKLYSLSGNKITDDGAKIMCETLKNKKNINYFEYAIYLLNFLLYTIEILLLIINV